MPIAVFLSDKTKTFFFFFKQEEVIPKAWEFTRTVWGSHPFLLLVLLLYRPYSLTCNYSTLLLARAPKTKFEFHIISTCHNYISFYLSIYLSVGPHPQHKDVRLATKSELRLPAYYATATATQDLSRICDPHHSWGQRGSLTHWVKPGIEPGSPCILVRFFTAEPQQRNSFYFLKLL